MVIKKHDRQYDLVVLGATGYTGILTAEHITTDLPSDLKWAVAGRSESKLRDVVAECKKLNPDRLQPEIEICSLNQQDLDALVKKTATLITTIGPYSRFGDPVFKACAENGTHYFDCTGEAPWVGKMLNKYEDVAKSSGALMFPQIGIESAPPDLITWSLAKTIREKLSAKTGDVTVSIHKLIGTPSGGTLATVFSLFDYFSLSEMRAAFRPYALSPVPNPQKVRKQDDGLLAKLFGVRSIPHLGTVTTSLAGSTDASLVHRSWGLMSTVPSRQHESWGPNFSFREFFRARGWLHGIMVHFFLGFLGIVISTPLRHVARKYVAQPGQGSERQAHGTEYIEQRGIAHPDIEGKSDQVAFCRAWYRGSLYHLTGVLMSQAAMTVLEGEADLPPGVFTASCLGQPFVDRLDKAGFHIESKLIKE